MRRWLLVAFVPVVFAFTPASSSPAAPVPQHLIEKSMYYYPTTVGTKLVYEGRPDGDTALIVTKVVNRNGRKVVTVEKIVSKDKQVPHEVVEVSPSAVIRTHSGHNKTELRQPEVVFKESLKVRDTWDFDHPERKENDGNTTILAFKGTNTIVGPETIKVPAGTFKAVRVDTEGSSGSSDEAAKGPKIQLSSWYSPNVGLVKLVWGDYTRQLKSFEPAKE